MKTALPPLLWRELESLFFSPLAYIVLTIFLLLNGVSFGVALTVGNGAVNDTLAYFLGGGHLFWVVLLIWPTLVTMRLVAEERRSGTLEMVLTAPVRDGEVVLAKFIGALVFQAFLWAPTLIYIVIIRRYGALPDPGQLFTAYLGIASVTCLLTAAGLLFSTLTSNQIVAAVLSLVFNVLAFSLPASAPLLGLPWLEQVASTVSMQEHFVGSFSRGILDSGVLTFYGAGTLVLLFFATRSLEARRWR